jgi:3-(3-hydroxy-phenyl)propionate hydroxylase
VCKLDPEAATLRDAAFRAAERNRNGAVAITDVVPPIRAGLVDRDTGGMRLPEFIVQTPEGRRHFDRQLDGRFTLIAASALTWPGGHVVDASDRALLDWLMRHGADWALVRPDRYVFAIGTGQAALDTALRQLADQLHPAPAPTEAAP